MSDRGYGLDPQNNKLHTLMRDPDQPFHVLYIEDDEFLAELVREMLEDGQNKSTPLNVHFSLTHATTLSDGLVEIHRGQYDVILLDLSLPDAEGLDSIKQIEKLQIDLPLIVMTGSSDEDLAFKAIQHGVTDYFQKGNLSELNLKRLILHSIERRSVMRQLEESKLEALQSAQSRFDFLTTMSHEIRTPLATIHGYAEVLRLEKTTLEQSKQGAAAMLRASEYLINLVDNILDFSKLEAGKMTLANSQCSLDSLLCDLESLMELHAKKKEITFRLDIDYPLPRIFQTDRIRLRQVLVNLLQNAMKYSEHGGNVTLKVWYCTNREVLHFSIIDDGPGMTASAIKRIFEPFYRAETERNITIQGAGLGLAISHRLAQALNGELSIESSLGDGTTFTLELPLHSLQPDCLIHGPEYEGASIDTQLRAIPMKMFGRVLVIEPEIEIKSVLREILEGHEVRVDAAESHVFALMRACSQNYDFAILDLDAATLSVVPLLRQLREDGVTLPLIGVTNKPGLIDVPPQLQELGIHETMLKPFRAKDLMSITKRYLPRTKTVEMIHSLAAFEEVSTVHKCLHYIDDFANALRNINSARRVENWGELEDAILRLRMSEVGSYPHVSSLSRNLEEAARKRAIDEFNKFFESLINYPLSDILRESA